MPTQSTINIGMRWLACIAAGGTLTSNLFAETSAKEEALATWQNGLQQVSTISSNFKQEKRLALFRSPLHIHGRLFLSDDGSFAWETHDPMRHKLVVHDGEIRQWDEETRRIHTISMRDNPVAATIHQQMSAWFSGRFSDLSDTYEVTLESEAPVSLLFTPLEGTPPAGYVTEVQLWLRPDGQYLDRVKIEEKEGDTTLITFTNTVINQTLPDSIWDVETLSDDTEDLPAPETAE